MYLALRNNDETDSIIESLKTFDENLDITRYSTLTFIRLDTSYESGLSCYVRRDVNDNIVLNIYVASDTNNSFNLDFKHIYVVYSL